MQLALTSSQRRMARTTGLEPATSGVTGRHSNRLSYVRTWRVALQKRLSLRREVARTTGLEPATSGVTGRHSNRLSYVRPASRSAAMAAVYGQPPTLSSRRLRKVGRGSAGMAGGAPGPLPRSLHARTMPRMRSLATPSCTRARGALTMPTPGRLAQLVEHLVYTERVGGSSPSPPTRVCNSLAPFCAPDALAPLVDWLDRLRLVQISRASLPSGETTASPLRQSE